MEEHHDVGRLEDLLRLLPVFMKRLGEAFHRESGSVHRFTHAQFRVLVLTSKRDEWRMSDLANKMALSPGSLTLMMDRRIEDGLISRGRSEADRRVVIVRITEQGRAMIAERRAHLNRLAAAYIARLSPPERDELLQAVGTIVRFLEKHVTNSASPF
jgi:MarR family transcriptional regulator, organic hydroperoxide resistance regulator